MRAAVMATMLAWSGCSVLQSFDGLMGGSDSDAGGSDSDAGGSDSDAGLALEASPDSGAEAGGPDGASYVATVLADRPVAYWRLGDGSGTTARDVSGHGNDGTSVSCTLGAAGAILGDPDTATKFDGTASGITSGADLLLRGRRRITGMHGLHLLPQAQRGLQPLDAL